MTEAQRGKLLVAYVDGEYFDYPTLREIATFLRRNTT